MTNRPEATCSFDDLTEIVERLLGPGGCPWDREQTHASLRRYLLEESYELIEAIDAGDSPAMAEELGDLLVHVLFHAEMARLRDEFELDDVILSAARKMIGRHPHVFGDVTAGSAQDVLDRWDDLKRKEKGEKRLVSEAVPKAMPALAYAAEIQNRVSRAGLCWRPASPAPFMSENAREDLLSAAGSGGREMAAGELLFNLVEELREAGVDPETALRRYAMAFRERLERTETAAGSQAISDLPPGRLKELWDAAAEREPQG